MKNDKNEKTPYIMRTTKHFNDVCCSGQGRCSSAPRLIRPPVFIPPPDKQPDCHRDPALRGRGHSRGGHREMGGRGRHLPLPPQLQRRVGDHLLPQPQLCVPPQEDLAQGVQAGSLHDRGGGERFGRRFLACCLFTVFQNNLSYQTKALIDKLQKLVSSEGRFKNLREALKK